MHLNSLFATCQCTKRRRNEKGKQCVLRVLTQRNLLELPSLLTTSESFLPSGVRKLQVLNFFFQFKNVKTIDNLISIGLEKQVIIGIGCKKSISCIPTLYLSAVFLFLYVCRVTVQKRRVTHLSLISTLIGHCDPTQLHRNHAEKKKKSICSTVFVKRMILSLLAVFC